MDKNQPVKRDIGEAWNRMVDNTYTIEDLALLLDSVKGDKHLQEFYDLLDRVWNEALTDTPTLTKEQEEAYCREAAQFIVAYERKKKKRLSSVPSPTIVRFRKIWYAAAVIALLVVSFLFIKLQLDNRPAQNVEAIIAQAMPSNEIRLISGKKVVDLKQNAQIALKDGRISVVEESNVSEMSLSENMMNKLMVPAGKRSTLRLADGTQIWLNAGTELDFPSEFTGNTREINVKGEIYIEVAKGLTPFYVNTSQFRVQVHGTKFNISAYGENEENSVVLVEGSVEVVTFGHEPTWLAPNEKVAVSTGEILKETVNVDEYTGWKDGVLVFNKTTVSEVLKKIGRYYNVHFENNCGKELSAEIITGKLILIEDFEELMIALSNFFSMQYHKEGDMIYLTKKSISQ